MTETKKIVDFLNNLLKMDKVLVQSMFGHRSPVNSATADSPHIICKTGSYGLSPTTSPLGLLNSIIQDCFGYNIIEAVIDGDGMVIQFQERLLL